MYTILILPKVQTTTRRGFVRDCYAHSFFFFFGPLFGSTPTRRKEDCFTLKSSVPSSVRQELRVMQLFVTMKAEGYKGKQHEMERMEMRMEGTT